MRELFWVAERVLHHVKAGFAASDATQVQEEGGEDEGQLHQSIVIEIELDCLVAAVAEEHLHHEDKEGFEEHVELSCVSHL